MRSLFQIQHLEFGKLNFFISHSDSVRGKKNHGTSLQRKKIQLQIQKIGVLIF